MKKKILLIIIMLLLIPMVKADYEMSEDLVSGGTYIIGKYMFTRNTNKNYDGKLTTRRIMLAAKTIEGTTESDMIIYYKKADGTWIDGLSGEELPGFDSSVNNYEPHIFDLVNIDLEDIDASRSKVRVYYHINGGTINSSTYNIDNGGWVIKDGTWVTHTVGYDDIVDLFNVNTFGITKSGYIPKSGEEWCTGADGTGTCYSQDITYDYNQLKNGSTTKDGFYELDLYINWEDKPLRIYFHPNGGTVDSDTYIVTPSDGWISKTTSPSTYFYEGLKELPDRINSEDLFNVNTFGITKSGYIPKSGEEWCNENKNYCFNQDTVYTYDQFVAQASSERANYYELDLWVNWVPKMIYFSFNMSDSTFTSSSSYQSFSAYNSTWVSEDGNSQFHQELNSGNSINIYDVTTFGLTKSGKRAKPGYEWCTALNGGGTCFNQVSSYTYATMQAVASETSTNYYINLYVNWEDKPVYIYYNPNGGTVGASRYTTYKDWLSEDGMSYFYLEVPKNQSSDLHNVTTFGLTKTGSTFNSGSEWCTENNGYCFNQDTVYTYDQFVAQASSEHTNYYEVDLWVNWGEPQFIKLGTIELGNEILKIPNYDDSVIIGQGFTIAGDYYVAAKISSDDTKADISIYNRKTLAKVNSFRLTEIGHANDLAYNPNTGEIYTVGKGGGDPYARSFKLSDALNGTPEITASLFYYNNGYFNESSSFHGIDYDTSNNKHYTAREKYIYIYDDSNVSYRRYSKIDFDVPQGIAAYNGKVLIIRCNFYAGVTGNVDTTSNVIDIYRASNGDYLGSYEIAGDALDKELESLAYNPDTGKFAFYFIDDSLEYGYIYEATMAIPE